MVRSHPSLPRGGHKLDPAATDSFCESDLRTLHITEGRGVPHPLTPIVMSPLLAYLSVQEVSTPSARDQSSFAVLTVVEGHVYQFIIMPGFESLPSPFIHLYQRVCHLLFIKSFALLMFALSLSLLFFKAGLRGSVTSRRRLWSECPSTQSSHVISGCKQ